VAVVIVGGLVSSTLLDMAVTPAVFLTFGRAAAERSLRHSREDPLDVVTVATPASNPPTHS
jgi:hypothetical protein